MMPVVWNDVSVPPCRKPMSLVALLLQSMLLCLFAAGAAHAAQPAGELKAPVKIAMIEGMSGSFANAGEAVKRNLQWKIEQINAAGGVRLSDGRHLLQLEVMDNKQGVEESLNLLRQAEDKKIPFVVQGNSSAVASALIAAIDKHNQRNPDARMLFLNYAAVDPALTNQQCSFWHFRFDAGADMRMQALTEVIRRDSRASRVYLIGQDYSFGRQVSQLARAMLAAKRPDIRIVGDELHPLGKIKDFAPYVAKIRASGADTVITGNWGNDLTLLIRAAREAGLQLKFYTFYANALGAPAAIGEAGVGSVRAVAEWHPNVGGAASDAFYQQFRQRYPDPQQDYAHLRMQLMLEMLVRAIQQSGSTDAVRVARALEGMNYQNGFHHAVMRAADHQLLQNLYVSVMQRQGTAGVRFDNEDSGFGFRTEQFFAAELTALPSSCKMVKY